MLCYQKHFPTFASNLKIKKVMKTKIAISPVTKFEDGIEYLTKGKEYKIIKWSETGLMFYIEDNTGDVLNCMVTSCAHLNGKKWTLL